MIRGHDLTFPSVQSTGKEESPAALTTPDERSLNQRLTVEALQTPFFDLEERLPSRAPRALYQRLTVARKLATYGFYCYEFHAVSVYWSVSCIEMALKLRFAETQPESITLSKKNKSADVPLFHPRPFLPAASRLAVTRFDKVSS